MDARDLAGGELARNVAPREARRAQVVSLTPRTVVLGHRLRRVDWLGHAAQIRVGADAHANVADALQRDVAPLGILPRVDFQAVRGGVSVLAAWTLGDNNPCACPLDALDAGNKIVNGCRSRVRAKEGSARVDVIDVKVVLDPGAARCPAVERGDRRGECGLRCGRGCRLWGR